MDGLNWTHAAAAAAGAAGAVMLSRATSATSTSAVDVPKSPAEVTHAFLSNQVDRVGNSMSQSKSAYFASCRDAKLILSEAEIDRGVQKVADFLNNNYVGEKIVLCGILKGAFIFITDLCRKLRRPYSIYFVEASSYSGQKQSDNVELLSRIVPSKFEGRRVILVDELLDNGHTMHTMMQHLMTELSIPRAQITTCVLFEKHVATRDKSYDAELCGIPNLPNVWLVGYGLDDNGTKRGWTELIAVPKIPGVPKSPDDAIFDAEGGDAKLAEIRAGLLSAL